MIVMLMVVKDVRVNGSAQNQSMMVCQSSKIQHHTKLSINFVLPPLARFDPVHIDIIAIANVRGGEPD